MEWWHIYLFTRLDSVNSVVSDGLKILGPVLAVALLVLLLCYSEIKSLNALPRFMKILKIAIAAFCFLLLGSIAVPTQKEAAAIYLLPKLAKSDFAKEAQQIPTEVAKLMRLKLESWVADMGPKKAEGK